MSIGWIPNFKFSNGVLAVGPFRDPQTEKMGKFTTNQWDIDGTIVYVYSTGVVPTEEIERAKNQCRDKVAKWPRDNRGQQ